MIGVPDEEYMSELVWGFASALAGLGRDVLWAPDTDYDPEDTRTIIQAAPPGGAPDNVLGVVWYDGGSTTTPGVDARDDMVQVHTRTAGTYLSGLRMQSRLSNLLHERTGVVLGKVRASLILSQSTAYLGLDAGNRQRFTQNFLVRGTGRVLDTGGE